MKIVQKKIDGILLLDKPLGITSNAALQRVKRLFNAKKAGHTGSLDPLATGMLPICFGEAAKFSQFLLDSDKAYHVICQLGEKTTTGDAEGQVIEARAVIDVTVPRIESILRSMTGQIQQIPPMFSALKHQGKPLYELARQGIEVERQPRSVMIYSLQLVEFQQTTLTLTVHCSKGTYVRTLVEDIGEQLGCGAHVIGLRRTTVTPYPENQMITLAALEEMAEQRGADALMQRLLPIESSVQLLPEVKLSASAAYYIRMGQPVMTPQLPREGWVKIVSEQGRFMGVGEMLEDGRVTPRRMVA